MADRTTQSGDKGAERSPAAPASQDSPKRQGDKLAGATGSSSAPADPASDQPSTGDSPKRQGDPLRHAVDEAAKG